MIEEKFDSEEVILINNSYLEDKRYNIKGNRVLNNNTKNYYTYYRVHLREIFYRFSGRHLFPDRG